jgi:acyl-CoA thioesterase II
MRTVQPEKHVHSLHAYFLMAGDAKRSIVYQVKVLRDGKSFSARLVTASQSGNTIFVLLASFQIPHPLGQPVIDHQIQMPSLPQPEELFTTEEYYRSLLDDPRCPAKWRPFIERRTRGGGKSPIDMRPAIVSDFFHRFGEPPAARSPKFPQISRDAPKQAMWIRAVQRLPDEPSMHAAVLAFASDMGLLATAKHDVSIVDLAVIASLDHSMFFHRPFRADEWLLYYLESPRATDGRGFAHGYVFTRSGTLVVSVAQEGVLRLRMDSLTRSVSEAAAAKPKM